MNTSLWHIFKWPALLALLSTAGLLSALVADGPWDAVSWLGLGVPLVVGLWFALRRPAVVSPGR